MVRISIDDSVSESGQWDLNQSVEDVVNSVLSELPPNRVVTSISIDGRQVPRQQSSERLKESLQIVKELQIRTGDAQLWAIGGMERAISDIERLQKSLILAAELFREDRKPEGNRIFLHCVEGLERFLDTIVLTRLAMKLDFQKLNVDGISLARLEKDFSLILTGILDCQVREDYEGVADKVEYELLTCFHSWTRALKQLSNSMHSNA
jgi:hypothetical protein